MKELRLVKKDITYEDSSGCAGCYYRGKGFGACPEIKIDGRTTLKCVVAKRELADNYIYQEVEETTKQEEVN